MIEIKMPRNFVTLISDEDSDLASLNWSVASHGYVNRRNGKHHVYLLHRVVLERIIGRPLIHSEIADHVDQNKLNNQRSNLRLASHSLNHANQGLQKNNTSGYRGVSFSMRSNRWSARIKVNQNQINLGTYKTPDEAAEAYNNAAIKYFGGFAQLNVIPR